MGVGAVVTTQAYLVNTYPTSLVNTWTTTVPLTVTFTPVIGEILVIKVVTEDSTNAPAALPTITGGGAPTVTPCVSLAVASDCAVYIWTTAPITAATSTTVNCLKQLGFHYYAAMVVERWSNAHIAASPHTGSANVAGPTTGTPAATIANVAASSAISWCNGDWSALSTARTYNGASGTVTEDPGSYVTASGIYTAYFATQTVGGAGTQTIGLTAPTGEVYSIVGIEILAGIYSSKLVGQQAGQQAVGRASLW